MWTKPENKPIKRSRPKSEQVGLSRLNNSCLSTQSICDFSNMHYASSFYSQILPKHLEDVQNCVCIVTVCSSIRHIHCKQSHTISCISLSAAARLNANQLQFNGLDRHCTVNNPQLYNTHQRHSTSFSNKCTSQRCNVYQRC